MVSGLGLSLSFAWLGACLKVVFVFSGIVMIRICTPRLGLGALPRLAWGSTLMYLMFFFLIYLGALLWV
jgi:hypothetical protein